MIIVTGSGRSGTSAVARLLHEAGLPAGLQLVAADDFNVEGYFEERPLIEINQHILQDAGLGGFSHEASRAAVLDAAQPYIDAMVALAETATPVWKDPRFSWTLEPWLGVFEGRPQVVVCLRNPTEVVASTLRYYGQVSEEAAEHVRNLWRNQYQRLLAVIADYGLPATCVDYTELHTNTRPAVVALSRFIGRDLDPDLVRRDLRHHAAETPVADLELYERVRALGSAGRNSM
jgi:hypothetical protein